MKSNTDLFKEIKDLGFHPFMRDETDDLKVSMEYDDMAGDYYDAPKTWEFGINPKLTQFAKDNGCFWEWQNPACIVLREI